MYQTREEHCGGCFKNSCRSQKPKPITLKLPGAERRVFFCLLLLGLQSLHRSRSRLCAFLRADALFCRSRHAAFLSDLFEAYDKAEEPPPEIKISKQKGPFLRGPFCLLSVIKLYKKGLELVYVNPLTRGFDGLIRRLPYLTSIA